MFVIFLWGEGEGAGAGGEVMRASEGLLNFIFIVSIIGIEFNAVLDYGIVS